MPRVVVDTNVAVVASGMSEQGGPTCVHKCVGALVDVSSNGLFVDESGEILNEYLKVLGHSGRPDMGRAFVKWVFDNQANRRLIRKVPITRSQTPDWRLFEEFPADESLKGFHNDDQKFVAVAVASGENPRILNAVDSDWWDYREQLAANGVRVNFLCPESFDASREGRGPTQARHRSSRRRRG